MSNPTYLQSSTVPFALSSDGNTYKNVVCKKTWDWNFEKTVVEDESDCGPAIGVNTASTKTTFNFEFLLNTTPNNTDWVYDSVFSLFDAGTLVYVKTTGSGYYRQGSGYFTNLKETAALNGLVTITGTFRGTSSIDITA